MTQKTIEAECKEMSIDQLKAKARSLAIEYYMTEEYQKICGKITREEAARRIDMLQVGATRTNLIKDIKSMSRKLKKSAAK